MPRAPLLTAHDVFSVSPIIPVIVIDTLAEALSLARALVAAGIEILEVALRTPIALTAIETLRQEMPTVMVGVGTVTSPLQLQQSLEAGAQFAFSPGSTQALLQAAANTCIPFIPGVSSVSELMEGMALGEHFKFFPAEMAGGIALLQAIQGLFPQVRFCATGGIYDKNFLDYLRLPNVECVGGSWIVPKDAIKQQSWQAITELAFSAKERALHLNNR